MHKSILAICLAMSFVFGSGVLTTVLCQSAQNHSEVKLLLHNRCDQNRQQISSTDCVNQEIQTTHSHCKDSKLQISWAKPRNNFKNKLTATTLLKGLNCDVFGDSFLSKPFKVSPFELTSFFTPLSTVILIS